MPNTTGPRKGIRDWVAGSRQAKLKRNSEDYVKQYNAAVDRAADKNKWGDSVRSGHKLKTFKARKTK